jgi:hypothetical protein
MNLLSAFRMAVGRKAMKAMFFQGLVDGCGGTHWPRPTFIGSSNLSQFAMNRDLNRVRDVLDEARAFLSLPRPEPPPDRFPRQPPFKLTANAPAT